MSNIVEKLRVKRIGEVDSDLWSSLTIKYYLNGTWHHSTLLNISNQTEDEALSTIVDVFVNHTDSQHLRDDIVEGFRQLRQNNQDDEIEDYQDEIEIYVLTHISCSKNQKESSTDLAGNEISQSDLKQKLASLDKNAEALKFFEKNKCSVCLSNYKEIVDEDLHIVVPKCGHALCCKCADEILRSEKKDCPQCRGNILTDSFELLKINSDLEVVLENQVLYLEN